VANVWAIGLLVMAAVFWFSTKDDPALVERRRRGEKPPGTLLELSPSTRLETFNQRWIAKLFLIIQNPHPATMTRCGCGLAWRPVQISRSVLLSSW